MAEVVSFCKNAIQNTFQLCSAVASFNYRLVSAIIRGATELASGTATILANLAHAFAEIIYYIGDICLETTNLVASCIRLVQKFFMLVCHLIGVVLLGLYTVFLWVVVALGQCLTWACDGATYCFSYLSSLWTLVAKTTSVSNLWVAIQETLSQTGMHIVQTLTDGIEVCLIKTVDTLNFIGSLAEAKSHTFFLFVCEGLTGLWSCIKDSGCWVWSVTGSRVYSSGWAAAETVYSWIAAGSTFVVSTLCGIPVHVYLYVLGTTVTILIFKMLMEHLHRRGMTFPMFHFSSYSQTNRRRQYFIDSSDEESMSEDEGEEEEEDDDDDDAITGQTDLDDLYNDADMESQMSGETEEIDGNSDSDEVEEFDIATDSESDEEAVTPIQIELPHRGVRYNLRTRASPVPTLSDGRLTHGDLERVLESERDKRSCVVCQDQLKTVLVLPCRHMCLCVECAHEIANSRNQTRRVCPLCRSRMETVMNVYV